MAVLSADPVPSVQSEPKDLATPDILNPTPSSQLSLPSFDNVLEEMKKEPEPWSMQDLVSYNPNSIVGRYRKGKKREKEGIVAISIVFAASTILVRDSCQTCSCPQRKDLTSLSAWVVCSRHSAMRYWLMLSRYTRLNSYNIFLVVISQTLVLNFHTLM